MYSLLTECWASPSPLGQHQFIQVQLFTCIKELLGHTSQVAKLGLVLKLFFSQLYSFLSSWISPVTGEIKKEQTKQEVCEAMDGKVRVQWNNMEEGLESLRERGS